MTTEQQKLEKANHQNNLVVEPGGLIMITEQKIMELAYAIWEGEGRPEGKDLEHYFSAKQILQERQDSSTVILAPSPTSKLPHQPSTSELAPPVPELHPGQHKYRRHTHH